MHLEIIEFPEKTLSDVECELWESLLTEDESTEEQCIESRWFDYRFDHSLINTCRFARTYNNVIAYLAPRYIDHSRLRHIKGWKADSVISDQSLLSASWKGRQRADSIGMPYGVYIKMGIIYRMERTSKPHLPQIYHLHSEDVLHHCHQKSAEDMVRNFRVPTSSQYLNENYIGLEDQDRQQSYLSHIINNTPNRTQNIAHYLFRDKRLLESTVIETWGESMLAQASAYFSKTKQY